MIVNYLQLPKCLRSLLVQLQVIGKLNSRKDSFALNNIPVPATWFTLHATNERLNKVYINDLERAEVAIGQKFDSRGFLDLARRNDSDDNRHRLANALE